MEPSPFGIPEDAPLESMVEWLTAHYPIRYIEIYRDAAGLYRSRAWSWNKTEILFDGAQSSRYGRVQLHITQRTWPQELFPFIEWLFPDRVEGTPPSE